MDINSELIEKIAKNARLQLTNQEKEEFLPQLKEILESFSILNKAPIDSLHPSFQPYPIKNIFRGDHLEKCLTQKEALQNTSLKKDGFFLGPRAF